MWLIIVGWLIGVGVGAIIILATILLVDSDEARIGILLGVAFLCLLAICIIC